MDPDRPVGLTETPKSRNWGGKRVGAGRKQDPLKDVRTGTITAQRILKEINDETEIPKLYKRLNAYQKMAAIFRLREQAYGKAPIAEIEKPKTALQVNVNIHRIGD